LIIIFSVRPLEDFLIKVTDKYLFQKKYNYAHIVNEFAEDLRVMALNTKDIAQSTVDFLEKTLRLNKAAIFIYNKFTGKYESIASYGLKEADTTFKSSDEIIKILKQSADIIELHKANAIKKSQEERLESLGVKLVVPLSIHKELLGVLLLGQKKSDEEYAKEDTEVLKGFSSTLTIALNNAQLFGERADAEKRALVGTLATGINHEIGNPLNIMSIKFESYNILKERGFYDGKSKEEIMKVFDDISIACSENIQRIGGIARQIAEFAKPDKSLTFTKVNIGETVDKITNVLKHGMIIGADKIVTKIVPSSLCVIVDRGQFEQVLFNLIKNACNAIDQDKGKIIIEGEQIGNEEIRIKVKDDGRGMPLSVRDKIFMPFFTTKEPGKGTGLGLTLTKIMVEKNDGKITVDSEDGKGTTFTIFLRGGI
ncbi:MAG: GAF domain-containing protein, partial [Candidatus Omnitrophica bacterium]|nr:GAF domain-containing protein [Candidatus Omnitrophota bacterium]